MNNITELTQKELDELLKQDKIVDKELNDTIHYSSISEIMKYVENARKKTKIYTQEQLAEEIGISYPTYKRYMNGQSDNLTIKALMNLAYTLDIDIQIHFKSVDKILLL